MTMDKLHLHELKIETYVGCLTWEQHVKQSVFVDLTVDFDSAMAGQLDDLSYTIDYSTIAATITSFIENGRFQLIESLAEKTAALIFEKFDVAKIQLAITKPAAVKNAKSVSINITRSKNAAT